MRGGTPWLLLGCALFMLVLSCAADDLYAVLGVPKTASPKAIRSAYLKLAKKWHPDKNRSPDAPKMMARINHAFEILRTERLRKRYDVFGDEDSSSPRKRHDDTSSDMEESSWWNWYYTSGDEEESQSHHKPNRGQSSFHFHGQPFSSSFNPFASTHPPDRVSSLEFLNKVVPDSEHVPQLVFYYNDQCQSCQSFTHIWAELKDDLLDVGIVTASVDTSVSILATEFCNVKKAPSFKIILNEKCHWFTESFDVKSVIEFTASQIPDSVLFPLPSDHSFSAMDRIDENKPVVIVFSGQSSPPPILLLIAFAQRELFSIAFVSGMEGKSLRQQLGVEESVSKDLLVALKDRDVPADIKEYTDSDPVALKKLVEEHAMLFLPRFSSQSVMEKLCPYRPSSRACLILLVENSAQYNDTLTHSFRLLAIEEAKRRGISLGYIDSYKQNHFLRALEPIPKRAEKCPHGISPRPVLLLKRLSMFHARYKWFEGYCGSPKDSTDLFNALSDDVHNDVFLNILIEEVDPKLFVMGMIKQLYEATKGYVANHVEQTLAFVTIFLPFILLTFGSAVFRKKQSTSNRQRQPVAGGEDHSMAGSKSENSAGNLPNLPHPVTGRKDHRMVVSERESSAEGPPSTYLTAGRGRRRTSPQPEVMTSRSGDNDSVNRNTSNPQPHPATDREDPSMAGPSTRSNAYRKRTTRSPEPRLTMSQSGDNDSVNSNTSDPQPHPTTGREDPSMAGPRTHSSAKCKRTT